MTILAAPTVGMLRRRVAARIEAAFGADGRSGNAALDARIIVAYLLGSEPASLALSDDQTVGADLEKRAMALADRRVLGEPVARITGNKEFWGLDFTVSPDTLVPRPDTETIVSAALAFLDRAAGREAPLAILDLGTGSGAVLLALLSELPNARGIGTDMAGGAIAVAAENAERLGLARRALFAVGDWGRSLRGGFDLVVSNPPYIESRAISGLMVDVGGYDPHLALDGGTDGLDAYRAILGDLPRLLRPEGRSFLEIGAGQAYRVAGLAEKQGFEPRWHRDLAGIDRVVELLRKPLALNGSGAMDPKNMLGNPPRTS